MRAEQISERDGIRYRVVVEQRIRYPDKPLRRARIPAGDADPDALLLRFSSEREQMARRLLKEGARGWRRWSTLRRHAGRHFSPFAAEEVLDELVRHAGLHVEDRHRNGGWTPERFRVDESMWPWLEIVDPEAIIAALRQDLARPELLTELERGRPPRMDWRSFEFCLRAAERALDLREHDIRPSSRELAGLIDHTKAFTEPRRDYVAHLTGMPFRELVAEADRQLGVKGPLWTPDGAIWASNVETLPLRLDREVHEVVLVENKQTFEHLLQLSEHKLLLIWVPGGPPPAEVELTRRLHELQPRLRFHACFDLDPAGIRIARLLAEKAGITLEPTGMTPDLLTDAPRKLPLQEWDYLELARQSDRTDNLEPLSIALANHRIKVEQETIQRSLYRRLLATASQTVTATA